VRYICISSLREKNLRAAPSQGSHLKHKLKRNKTNFYGLARSNFLSHTVRNGNEKKILPAFFLSGLLLQKPNYYLTFVVRTSRLQKGRGHRVH
jgi:hypothetical protein